MGNRDDDVVYRRRGLDGFKMIQTVAGGGLPPARKLIVGFRMGNRNDDVVYRRRGLDRFKRFQHMHYDRGYRS